MGSLKTREECLDKIMSDGSQYTIALLIEQSRGRWVGILSSAGLPDCALDAGYGGPCPGCDVEEGYRVDRMIGETGIVSCNRCFNESSKVRPRSGLATIRWWNQWSPDEAAEWLAGHLGYPDSAEHVKAVAGGVLKPELLEVFDVLRSLGGVR